jgi:hypothetical protein
MPISDAERKRASRARQKAAQRAGLKTPPANPTYVAGSFAAFMKDRDLALHENLDAFGACLTGSGLDQDRQAFPSQVTRDAPLTSLERAIGLVDVLIDAARELADEVNAYKLAEIDARIIEAVENSANLPRGDVAALKAALARIEALKMIRADLTKPTRHLVAAIRAKGE